MQEADVVKIVESSIAKKNEGLLAAMRSMLDNSLVDFKRSHADTADTARIQAKQNLLRNKSKFASNRREPSALTQVAAATPTQFFSNIARPIPTVQPRTQTKPGSCYTCNKPGH